METSEIESVVGIKGTGTKKHEVYDIECLDRFS